MTIMPGHNDIGGIPAHASHWLLTDVVKNEFGFMVGRSHGDIRLRKKVNLQ